MYLMNMHGNDTFLMGIELQDAFHWGLNSLGWVIDPNPHEDDRVRFRQAWCPREFAEHGLDISPIQTNMGFSIR